MSTTELKANFHKLIDRIEDEDQLRVLYELVAESALTRNELDPLTSEQVRRILDSLKQIERSETIPNEVVMERAKQWLKR